MIFLGIDVGGTSVKTGIINAEGEVLRKYESVICNNEKPIIDTVIEAAKKTIGDYTIRGIGVSTSGQIDNNKKVIRGTCEKLKGWENTNIGEILLHEFSVPVSVANDGDCMCLAESWIGQGMKSKNIIGLTIGTGIGGAIICNGSLVSGYNSLGSELGYIRTHRCDKDERGYWESYASTKALVDNVSKYFPEIKNGKDVFLAAKGNILVQGIIESWVSELSIGICDLIYIFNPEVIIIGGGISAQFSSFGDQLVELVKRDVLDVYSDSLMILPAKIGNNAGMIGAIYNLMCQYGFK